MELIKDYPKHSDNMRSWLGNKINFLLVMMNLENKIDR